MKVTIQQWNAVATWRWDMPEDDVCGICRVQFDGTCPTCKYPGDDCTLRMSMSTTFYVDWTPRSPLSYSYWEMRPLFPHGTAFSSPLMATYGTDCSIALPPDMDPTRLLQRTVSHVQAE